MSHTVTYEVLSADTAHLLQNADVFDNPVDQSQLDAFVDAPGHLLVFARVASRVIGFASGVILFHPDKQPMLFISEVGVEDDMRRRGIAAALCNQLKTLAEGQGCTGTWLATEDDNVAARALYRSLEANETEGVVVYDWGGVMDDRSE
ncbi:MAG: GNAT family N-acetyltransferase [Pseudomonadota bacterium]